MSVVINRVYTGVGDGGTTRLTGGQELKKSHSRIEGYGTVDELNAALGVVAEQLVTDSNETSEAGVLQAWVRSDLISSLRRIQNELFDMGGELATLPDDIHEKQALIQDVHIKRLEEDMDSLNKELPSLRSFVLPGGGMTSALMHHARTICRRAERRLVAFHLEEPQREELLKYLNRLSDWLFVAGRAAALGQGHSEVLWQPGDNPDWNEPTAKLV